MSAPRPIRHPLLATDFSVNADGAIDRAGMLPLESSVRVIILQVLRTSSIEPRETASSSNVEFDGSARDRKCRERPAAIELDSALGKSAALMLRLLSITWGPPMALHAVDVPFGR
jgi:hypothetical protein